LFNCYDIDNKEVFENNLMVGSGRDMEADTEPSYTSLISEVDPVQSSDILRFSCLLFRTILITRRNRIRAGSR
jgi:hypothetical protein